MDSLCSLSGQRECSSNEKQTKKQKVATMAWAAFQVLANRCIEWEKVEGTCNTYTGIYVILKKKKPQHVPHILRFHRNCGLSVNLLLLT